MKSDCTLLGRPCPTSGQKWSYGPSPALPSAAESALRFEANQGQEDRHIGFLARGAGYRVALTAGGPLLMFEGQGGKRATVRMRFEGGNPKARLIGEDPLPGKSNYFFGTDPSRWHTGIPHYARVKQSQVYPGVDLVFYGTQGSLEYDIVVAAGADPSRVEIAFAGVRGISVDDRGDLLVDTGVGPLRQQRPTVYQVDADNTRRSLPGHYVLKGRNRAGFVVGSYDRSKPLFIDPVLSYSTFLGGNDEDSAEAVAVDPAGNVYVTGRTKSSDFPVAGAPQPSTGGSADAYVAKFDPTLRTLLYATYLGGSLDDEADGIAVDLTGSAYITGQARSGDFPAVNGYRSTTAGSIDAFVVKLSPAGDRLVYATYLGGSDIDSGSAIAVDTQGAAYVTGYTRSDNFPTMNAVQPSPKGGTCGIQGFVQFPCSDAFVTKLDPSGTSLVYSTYLGSSPSGTTLGLTGEDSGYAITVDREGHAYVTGSAGSGSFTSVPGSLRQAVTGPNAFVARFDVAGSPLLYSAVFGGNNTDEPHGIAVDAAGSAHIMGVTASGDLPVTADAVQKTNGGGTFDAFVAKLDPAGAALSYLTYLGGSGNEDSSKGLTLDSAGNIYVTGSTSSTNFPVTPSALHGTNSGQLDAFLTVLHPSTRGLVFSTYLGGSGEDKGRGVTLDAAGNAHITGSSASADFPTTQGAFRPTKGSGQDVFVARIAEPAGQAIGQFVSLSAASYLRDLPLAPDSIVAGFGSHLAPDLAVGAVPLPESLLNTTVKVLDSSGQERTAQLYFVSPGQVNYVMPPGTALGLATVTVTSGDGSVSRGSVNIESVAPSLFSGNSNGQGVAAAIAVRYGADGSSTVLDVYRYDEALRVKVPFPIELGSETDQTALLLFGTGIRGRSSLSAVTATIGGVKCDVQYAGLQGEYPGFDQVNLMLPRTLSGRGEQDIVLEVDGKKANTITVSFGGQLLNPPPVITALNPVQAAAGQTIASFTITGSHLETVTGIEFIPSDGIQVTNLAATAGSVQVQVAIAAGAAAGSRTVRLLSPNGNSNSLTFVIVAAGPQISSVSPSTGQPGQSILNFTITGTNLSGASAIEFVPPDGISVSSLNSTATNVTAVLTISSAASTGARTFTVVTPAGRSNALNFELSRPLPHITSLSPSSLSPGQTVNLAVYGSSLDGTTAIVFSPPDGIVVSGVTATSASVTAQVAVSASAVTGTRSVTLVTPAGVSNALSLTIQQAAPHITSLAPSSGAQGQTIANFQIVGSYLTGATAIEFNPSTGITVSNLMVGASLVTAQVAIAAAAPAGARSVTVVTPAGRSNTLTFTVTAPLPQITSLNPVSGSPGQTIPSFRISGANLGAVTAIIFNPSTGVTVSNLVVTATQVTAQIVISSGAPTGTRQVTVRSPAGDSNPLSFTISAPASPVPVISAVVLSSPPSVSWPSSVTVTGSFNFTDGDADIIWTGAFDTSAQLKLAFSTATVSCTRTSAGTFLNKPGQTSGSVSFSLVLAGWNTKVEGPLTVRVSLIDAAGHESNVVSVPVTRWYCQWRGAPAIGRPDSDTDAARDRWVWTAQEKGVRHLFFGRGVPRPV